MLNGELHYYSYYYFSYYYFIYLFIFIEILYRYLILRLCGVKWQGAQRISSTYIFQKSRSHFIILDASASSKLRARKYQVRPYEI